ncbi:MmgE/PrpD family protein [uncultured Xylophilus sp.]|uniref:MmgE/PrpD family protein n=1 Tax=uncultured Xylophilus sp. TaxID=296832 RepID=UPI0025EDC2B0|nr:MmgE/PrpD family protein [uncultured Xylophilus sp.]
MDHTVSPPSALCADAPPAAAQETVAARLGAFVAGTDVARMPAAVVALARSRLLDACATAIAARGLPVPTVACAFVGNAAGAASVIGQAQRVPAADAAFVNATLVNGCTHDDFLAKSHAGAVAIPAALAAAEECGASGADLLAAVVAGYEVTARAYRGAPGMLPRFRATGVPGAVGAAAAAARALRLGPVATAQALGLGAMFASGFGEGFVAGTMDVKLNVGWASRSGVSAARLAACGATSAPTVFEGASGFFAAFGDSTADAGAALHGLGERFLIEDTVYKERPVCIFVQTPVQLARTLAGEPGFDAGRIEAVRIRAPMATLTNPGYRNVAPFATQLQARISARFTVAAALLGRPVDTYRYFDNLGDADVLALAERIELLPPGGDDTVVVQVQSAGRTFEAAGVEMDHLLPTADKVLAKFRRLTADLAPGRADRLLAELSDLEARPDVAGLAAALRDL